MAAVLATGCYRWAPVTSLATIEDERVHLELDEGTLALEHATARGRVIEGRLASDSVVGFSGCTASSCEIDATRAHAVMAHRLNVPVTVGLVTGIVLIVAGVVVMTSVGILSSQVINPPHP
jgi:hypothetical protein